MAGSGSWEVLVERLLGRVRELEPVVVQQKRVIATQTDRTLRRRHRRRWVLPKFTGTLMRDGYAGYAPLPGTLAKGTTDNHGHRSILAAQARRLIRRFTDFALVHSYLDTTL